MTKITRLAPVFIAATLILGGCMTRDHGFRSHQRVGVSVNSGDYDSYYDGSYGAFNDGYWGRDGAFHYSDSSNNWHRDDGRHFRRDRGDGGNWDRVQGRGHSIDN